MKFKYINNTKYLTRNGRLFQCTDDSQDAIVQAEWADDALKRTNVQFENGRWLHEAANEVLDKAEDTLVQYLVVTA